jgi:hypothetical protein
MSLSGDCSRSRRRLHPDLRRIRHRSHVPGRPDHCGTGNRVFDPGGNRAVGYFTRGDTDQAAAAIGVVFGAKKAGRNGSLLFPLLFSESRC